MEWSYLIIRQLVKFTFLGWFFSRTKPDSTELNNIKIFWEKVRGELIHDRGDTKKTKIVLVECLEKANPSWNSYYILPPLFLQKSNVKVIALTNYSSTKCSVSFLKNYIDVNNVESVYRKFDFRTKLNSILILFKNFPYKYSSISGISVNVKGTEIGDLVYDEYLRVAKKETLRKFNFLYLIMVYNSIYSYLRYKEIIEKYDITDIVAIRDTYSHSSFYRVKSNITIWKNRAGPMASIRKLKSNVIYNHKPFYFEAKHREYLRIKYSHKASDEKYNQIMLDRKKGNVNTGDSREIKLAHNHNEILTKNEFDLYYKYDAERKNIIIYAHVFVDAVRYPHSVIFSDHYTWLVETLEFLIKINKYNIMVKPHPSESLYSLGESIESVVKKLNLKLNGNVIILDKKIDFSVISSIADVVVTGSGTIAIEAPCEGVKVITCGSNSYENTEAMFRCESQREYFEALSNIDSLPDITPEKIINSKLGFIWLNSEMYIDSPLCIGFDKYSRSKEDFEKLDFHYRGMKIVDCENIIQRINDDRIN